MALREYAPDLLVLTGPGNTLGGVTGQLVVAEGYHGIRTRADFESAQSGASPLVLSMRRRLPERWTADSSRSGWSRSTGSATTVTSSSKPARSAPEEGPSKPRKAEYGHTPLTADEAIPWSAPRLIVGTGATGALPITDDLYREALERDVEVIARPTAEACDLLSESRSAGGGRPPRYLLRVRSRVRNQTDRGRFAARATPSPHRS